MYANGTCDVLYDDGDREPKVPRARLRAEPPRHRTARDARRTFIERSPENIASTPLHVTHSYELRHGDLTVA